MKIRRTTVIKGITGIAFVTFLLFATALDSESCIPMVVCSVCVCWLCLIAICNSR